jgi:hypothetical protein
MAALPPTPMRDPHLGREAEHQRTKAGGGKAGAGEDHAPRRPVGRQRRGEPDQRGGEEQQAVERDAAARVVRQRHVDLGRQMREDVDERPVGNVAKVECPAGADRDRISEDRAVAVELQAPGDADQDEHERPAETERDREAAQPEAGRSRALARDQVNRICRARHVGVHVDLLHPARGAAREPPAAQQSRTLARRLA